MRILVIDDDKIDYLLTERFLKNAFPAEQLEITWVSHPDEAGLQQKIDDHDVCLVDQNMGTVSGLDIIRRSTEHGSFTPIILLTGEDDKDVDHQASASGASDYLLKTELMATLLNRSIRFSIIQKQNQKKLSEYAYQDGLTGLANRIKFDQALELAINTSERAGTYLALFLIDLDDFKIINDTYGHPAGDAVLQAVADRISSMVRKTDIVARLGGDEFGIVLNGYKHEQDIKLLTRKILKVFEEPVHFNDQRFHCKCSLGIAILNPGHVDRSPSSLTKAADGALYKAKSNGKNSYAFFDEEIGKSLAESTQTENALINAIANNELELFFQPKVRADNQHLCGGEALLRWNRVDAEPIGPSDFIPIAERSLCIREIGQWVLEEACRHMRDWIDDGNNIVPISINVSPIQIQYEGFVEQVKAALENYSIAPSLIELEITETALVQQFSHLEQPLTELAKLGCKWVIDDFGVGHSSLSRLKDIPISKIKLDRSFVQHIETSPASQKICNVVSLLANELDLVLVAEGVEKQSQFDRLMLMSKDELQGFYFSKPLPAKTFKSMLEDVSGNEVLPASR